MLLNAKDSEILRILRNGDAGTVDVREMIGHVVPYGAEKLYHGCFIGMPVKGNLGTGPL